MNKRQATIEAIKFIGLAVDNLLDDEDGLSRFHGGMDDDDLQKISDAIDEIMLGLNRRLAKLAATERRIKHLT